MNMLTVKLAGRLQRLKSRLARRVKNERGATMLEWVLLLAVIGLPSFFIINVALYALIGNYQMMTTLNALPFP